jgi:hypothetical protein
MSNRQEGSVLAKGIGPFDDAVAGDGHAPRDPLIRAALPESARPRAQQCPAAKRHPYRPKPSSLLTMLWPRTATLRVNL